MTHNALDLWTQAAQQMQQTMVEGWAKALQTLQNPDLGSLGAMGAGGAMPGGSVPDIRFSPDKLKAVQAQYVQEVYALFSQGGGVLDVAGDRRFTDSAWGSNPLAGFTAAVNLLNARTMMGLADAVESDAKTRNRIRFAIEQWMAACAPSNFLAFNAEAQQKAVDTQGESIAKGLQNLLHDLHQGHVSMTDESLFEVGKNVATTEGSVVFQNEFFQLIEYKALTDTVFEKPFLMVPPCINKYYILDLQPANSLARYAVSQGHRTFMVSWRNPDKSLAKATWDDYIEKAVIQAITAVQAITGAPTINALGFCVGGTMLGTALAVLAARAARAADENDAKPVSVASATLLTSFLDFSDTGILDVFIDEAFVQYREKELGQGGLMKGGDLASTFSFLRPNDLVWNYVVGNYLKGETPPPFDLLYWNSDSTNLPGPYYAWYLRNTYLENNLVKPGKTQVCGQKIDLGLVDIPVYIYGSREDHIVPIGGAYASSQVLPGKKRFVMGASGHIAGVINPPAKNKRSYWVRSDGKLPKAFATWLKGADEHPGSWWTDWSAWLNSHGGASIPAPERYGKGKGVYKPREPAPGSYVKVRA